MTGDSAAAWVRLGHPSYVWRFGQDRRLGLIRQHIELQQRRILDVGCGIGTYIDKLRTFSDEVHGVDVDPERVAQASSHLPNIRVAAAEALPFPDVTFDVVLLNEVIEHVNDDRRAIEEAVRVTVPGGHIVVFAPNRLYPFETHGAYIGGRFVFGLIPLVNYLPNPVRNRFCPHVRAYTGRQLRSLFAGLPLEIVEHTCVFPGFDNIVARTPALGQWLRKLCYSLESTPLRALGLSHFVVARVYDRAGM